jgi:hypothetical protein
MSIFGTEKSTVQYSLIRYAEEVGWVHISMSEALLLRKGEGGLLFNRVLAEKIGMANRLHRTWSCR